MKLEILGAILAMIAPFLFHFLLQTRLRLRSIVWILIAIVLLASIPAIDFSGLNQYISGIPKGPFIKIILVAAVIILGIWQYFHRRGISQKKTG